MPQYMLQFAYKPETWAALTKNPVDRSDAIRGLAENLGGRFVSLNYTMGEYDGVVVVDAPDDVTALSVVLAAIGPGHVRSTKTARLYTPQEMMQAMKKAGGVKYTAPQG
ncbi:MAG TPA: GYD domain-containing protein [Thermoanaerobaculia bacterium]|jgi:uncharacterized protein with GYD domain|nr:GYD domain-containing protein [Thermoanaerobaculia bacterium]